MSVDIDDLALIAEKLTKDFEFYKNQKIFLTGGTGFFGKWLLETFIYLNEVHKLNISVTILSRSPKKFAENQPYLANHENFMLIKGDVRSFSDLNESYDLIIHAATDASVEINRTNPELMRDTILDGARNICDFSKKVGCKRILYTSSGAAYGPQPKNLSHIPETFLDNPLFNHNDAYASSKLKSEEYFKDNVSCDIVIARCFAFSGPYLPLSGEYAFGNFISDVLQDRNIIIKGDGTPVRSYLYAADLIIWLLRILSSGRSGEIYNVGSKESISIKHLAKEISLEKVETITLSKSDGNTNVYVPCIDKAETELGLKMYTSLKNAIIKTLKFEGYDPFS